MITLAFGLGEDISVIAIIGLPTFKLWKIVLDVDDNKATSKTLGRYFDLSYQHAASGLPPGVAFEKTDFIIPPWPNPIGQSLAIQLLVTKINPVVVTSDEDNVVLKLTQNSSNTHSPDNMNSEGL